MQFPMSRSIFLILLLSLLAGTLALRSQVSVAGRWHCTGTGPDAETVNFRLELKQSDTTLGGVWFMGDDEIPIREGKVLDNRIELITFADDKQFTSVAVVEGDALKGTWKDDSGRSGSWEGKRLPAGAR